MRNLVPEKGFYYHLFNRGVGKQTIFHNDRDYVRFLFLVLHFQSPISINRISDHVDNFIQDRTFGIKQKLLDSIISDKFIDLMQFCIMPNHFHLFVREKTGDGLSRYMQKVLNSYTKYYNIKYNRSGHVFQGPFKMVQIIDDKQSQYLSAYIHRNPCELKKWKNREHQYPWSSFQDYALKSRWGNLLETTPILELFDSPEDYKEFVDNSGAKLEKYLDI